MAVVVSDTSPVRALAHLDCMFWLDEFFGGVVLPPAVAAELGHPPGRFQPVDVSAWPFLSVQTPQNAQGVLDLRSLLDLGESEALVLAEELKADAILIDELVGRQIAMERGFVVVGTLGLLLRAKRQRMCADIRPLLDRLQQEINFFVSPALRKRILEEAGEWPAPS